MPKINSLQGGVILAILHALAAIIGAFTGSLGVAMTYLLPAVPFMTGDLLSGTLFPISPVVIVLTVCIWLLIYWGVSALLLMLFKAGYNIIKSKYEKTDDDTSICELSEEQLKKLEDLY